MIAFGVDFIRMLVSPPTKLRLAKLKTKGIVYAWSWEWLPLYNLVTFTSA
jgi:hypothetical protein